MHTKHASDHDPDGVPHSIVGLVGAAVFATAVLLLGAVATGRPGTAIALLFVAIPSLICGLDAHARRVREVSETRHPRT